MSLSDLARPLGFTMGVAIVLLPILAVLIPVFFVLLQIIAFSPPLGITIVALCLFGLVFRQHRRINRLENQITELAGRVDDSD